jgi:hypothetical protein
MVLLAVLDLAGAYSAKEAVVQRSVVFAAAGAACFLALFWVYASSLQYAELAPVTFGWIVILQVGVVLLDRFHYRVPVPTGAWIAMAIILAGQAYLLFALNGAADEGPRTPAPEGGIAAEEAAGHP